jgi:hypothetical protein
MFLRLSCALIGPRRAPAADLKSNQVVPDELAGCLGLTASKLAASLAALNALPAEDRSNRLDLRSSACGCQSFPLLVQFADPRFLNAHRVLPGTPKPITALADNDRQAHR